MNWWFTIAFGLLLPAAARAEERHVLFEKHEVGQQSKFELATRVDVELYFKQGERTMTRRHALSAEHRFFQHILKLHADGKPTQVARLYERAELKRQVEGAATAASLRPERRLIVAQRLRDETVSYSPNGPLTREELDLAGKHFDVLMLPHLLPDGPVAVDEEWELPVHAAQALCGLDGITENKLRCKLAKVTDDHATVTISGSAEGISAGCEVKLNVGASCLFDMKQEKLVAVNWRQSEVRNQGPVSAPLKLSLEVQLRREPNASCDALTPAVLGNIAAEPEAAYLLVHFRDPKGDCEFLHERGWHVLSMDENQAVLRLLDRGELIGQLNVSRHSRARPGRHMEPSKLKELAQSAPNFTVDQVLQSEEVPSGDSRWIYRHSVVGRAGDVKLMQNYYGVAAADGRQAVFVFTTEVDQADRLGGRDLAIIGTVTFSEGGKE